MTPKRRALNLSWFFKLNAELKTQKCPEIKSTKHATVSTWLWHRRGKKRGAYVIFFLPRSRKKAIADIN